MDKRLKTTKITEIIIGIVSIGIGLVLYFVVHVALNQKYFRIAPWILAAFGLLTLIFSLCFTRIDTYTYNNQKIQILASTGQREVYINESLKGKKNDFIGFLTNEFVIDLENNVSCRIKSSIFKSEVRIDGQLLKRESKKMF